MAHPRTVMLTNYIKVALRYLLKHKGYAALNIAGLALGIACCLLMLLYVQHELRYDRHHENADRIYRLVMQTESSGATFRYPSVGGGWAEVLVNDVPAVETAVRFFTPQQVWLTNGDQRFEEDRFAWADSTVFDVFTMPLIAGDAATALDEPFTVVLTESAARKYFGTPQQAVGQTLSIELGGGEPVLNVTGVVEDMPATSHFHFDFLGSMSSLREQFGPQGDQFLNNFSFTAFYTYFVAQPGTDARTLEAQLPALYTTYVPEEDKRFVKAMEMQALTDVHLRSSLLNEIEPNGNIAYVYIFVAIALLTLLIACINFMNLATARSAGRAKEVGLRKVVGADRRDLVYQFIGESMILAFLSLLVAVVLAEALLPVFNSLSGKELALDYLSNPAVLLGLLGIALFVGLFSGSYPALFLSSFQPAVVLKGTLQAGARSGALRKVLVIGQFAVSIMFLAGTGVVLNQLNFIQTTPLGFERAQRVVIPVPLQDPAERLRTIEVLEAAYRQQPGVVHVAAASNVPGQLRAITQVRLPGVAVEDAQDVTTVSVDHAYLETLAIPVIAGRSFDPDRSTDSTGAFLINEAMVRLLGLEQPVGQRLEWWNGVNYDPETAIDGTVIGVFNDLHFEPLHRQISPMMFRIDPQTYFTLVAEVRPENVPATLAAMERTWNDLIPTRPFAYSFLDAELAELYEAEQQLGDVVKAFALLAILIACLGLFGLASFTAQQRTKEIGVRKVLGASVPGIMLLLTKEFAQLIGIAFLIGVPIAVYGGSRWLQGFTYHADLNPWIFLAAGLVAFTIATITVSYQTLRAALVNPVKALRYE